MVDPEKIAGAIAKLDEISKSGLQIEGSDMILDTWLKIEERANELLVEHGLKEQGWTFAFSRSKTILGYCDYKKKRIEFSDYFVNIEWAEIEDTLRHEIAHALTPREAQSHGYEWKRVAARIGARPERCAPAEIESSAKAKFYLECPSCGLRVDRYRIKPATFHRYCKRCDVQLKVYKKRVSDR